MNEQPLRIDIKGSVPIAVGNQAEVWLLHVGGGLLASDVEGPMVRHVETGIVYGPSWAYRKEGAAIHASAPPSLDLHEGVTIRASWVGRVVHCRIASTSSNHLDQVTTLLLARESGVPPYR